MNKKSKSLIAAFSLLATGLVPLTGAVNAQTRKTVARQAAGSVASVNDPAALLPSSDAVISVDVKRILNEAVPLFLSGDPAQLADVNSEIANFKTKTGLDPRSFDRVAVGMKFVSPRPGVFTSDTVAIARGTFDSGAIVAAGRIAAKGKYEEQKYGNTTIYVFNLAENMNLLGVVNTKISQLAVAVLDRNTLALGDLQAVKAALDTRQVGAQNTDLIALASRTPGAFMGFGANVPAGVGNGITIANDEITKNINSIRQVYGSATAAGNQLDMFASAKTHNNDEAASLNDTLAALKQFGSMFVTQMPADKGKLAQSALENLKIERAGDEVQLKLSVPQADIAALMRTVVKKKA